MPLILLPKVESDIAFLLRLGVPYEDISIRTCIKTITVSVSEQSKTGFLQPNAIGSCSDPEDSREASRNNAGVGASKGAGKRWVRYRAYPEEG